MVEEESPAGKENYYSNIKCAENHPLDFLGSDYIYNNGYKCHECNNNHYTSSDSYIRWNCAKCLVYFCSLCRPLCFSESCPLNHEILYEDNHNAGFTCDTCGKQGYKEAYFDKKCNITLCKDCIKKEE